MKTFTYKISVLLLLAALGITSCKVTKTYQQPTTPVPSAYRSSETADTLSMAGMKWPSLFTDPVLQELIRAGLTANLDLKIAVQRINQSKALFRKSKTAYLPDLKGNVGLKQSKLADPQGFGIFSSNTQYDFGISSNWELDIWGKLGSAKRAAMAELLASDAAKRAVQTQLIADIANHYYDLLALDEQLVVTRKTAINRGQDAATIKLLFENSILNGVAVVQSEANYYEAELSIPDLEQQIREKENVLAVLLARNPGPIQRNSLAQQQLIYDLKPGIPAQLLAHRPDVQQAEYMFRAAFENTNIASTQFYPGLNITAMGGFSSFSLKDWFSNGSLFGNIAGGIIQPIFNKGQNKAGLAIALSQQQEALHVFELSLLKASQEVSDALSAYQAAAQKEEKRSKQLKALTLAVEFNKELMNNSKNTNYTDVLAAEQNLLTAELKAINDQSQKLHAVVNLYRALGGGWN
ncbi:efflux transporter outer membrane subunit [Pedobacter gandavensis]|uniref:efflux transporter outer membrane subunit n=1 Tax=Pedobacter TaxID=84567 RepID=UPI001C995352|nr:MULTISPECIES: efflux transporter outer membrane subunit [Pedobacter]WGQ10365.1 efflux transporter outer membrane subunit [Pedobacter gandavensis]